MTYLILHGSFGSPEENWFPWLKLKLEEKGHKVYLPKLPVDDFDNFKPENKPIQNLESWLHAVHPILKEIIESADDLTIIAHSISPAFVLSLMQAEPKLKLKKLIAVAPFLHHGEASKIWQIEKVNDSFLNAAEELISDPAGLNTVKSRIGETIVIYSDNDPYVNPGESIEYSELLDARPVEIKGGGHFNTEAGYTKFEQLLNLVY